MLLQLGDRVFDHTFTLNLAYDVTVELLLELFEPNFVRIHIRRRMHRLVCLFTIHDMVAYDFFNIICVGLILSVEVRVNEVHGCVSDRPLLRLRVGMTDAGQSCGQHLYLIIESVVRGQEALDVALLEGDEVGALALQSITCRYGRGWHQKAVLGRLGLVRVR